MNVGINAVKRNPLELVGGFFIVTLLGLLPGQVPNVLQLVGVVSQNSPLYWVLFGISTLVGAAVGAFFWVGEVRVALAAARGEPFDFGLFFSGADRAVPLLITNFLVSIAVALGLVLLIVPGIVLALGLAFGTVLVVDAEESPVEALKASWEATQGHKMQLFLFGLTALLVLIAGMCACYVGVFVAIPVLFVAFVDVYRRVTGRMGASSDAATAAPFGY